MSTKQKILAIVGGSIIVGSFLFYLLFLNHVSVNEIGVAYNPVNGSVTKQEHAGWYFTNPLVRVSYLSTLPIKVTIPSQARVIVQKLVRFKPAGLNEYIELQGFSYGLNSDQENVLLGYAFSGQDYSFMEILQEPGKEKK